MKVWGISDLNQDIMHTIFWGEEVNEIAYVKRCDEHLLEIGNFSLPLRTSKARSLIIRVRTMALRKKISASSKPCIFQTPGNLVFVS